MSKLMKRVLILINVKTDEASLILINVKTDEASLKVTAFVLFAVIEYYVSECIDYTCAKTETTQTTTKKEKELNETTANVWTGADRNIGW